MKKCILILILTLGTIFSVAAADDETSFSIGVSVAAGGRYDDVRMCVASPAGTPGGAAFEPLGLVMEYRFNERFGMGMYLPIARPIIFALNTQMLQFLPEIVFNIHVPIDDYKSFVISPAIGASLHYGPDYLSDKENRGVDFFAAGPRFSLLGGIALHNTKNHEFIFGLKPYTEFLFSEYRSGVVFGGEFDFQYRYRI